MEFILVFMAYLSIELIAVLWTKSVASGKVFRVMGFSGFSHCLVIFGVTSFLKNGWLLFAVVAGAMTGAYLGMKIFRNKAPD